MSDSGGTTRAQNPAPAVGMKSATSVRRVYAFLISADYLAEFLWGITGTLYYLDRGLDPAGIGMMIACFWWAEAIFQIPSGVIADTFGRKPAVIAGYLTRAVGYLLVALLPNLTFGVIGFIIVGLGSTFTGGAAEAWAIDEIETSGGRPADLDRFFSISKVAENSGMVLGSLVGGLVGSISLAAPFYLTVLLFLLIAGIGTVVMRESRSRDGDAHNAISRCASILSEALTSLRTDGRLRSLIGVSILPRALGAAPGIQWNVYLSTFISGQYIYLGAIRTIAYLGGLLAAATIVPLMTRGVSRSALVCSASVIGGVALALCAHIPGFVPVAVGYVIYIASRSIVEPGVLAALSNRVTQIARATMLSVYSAIAGLAYGVGYLVFGLLVHNLEVIRYSWTLTGLFTAATGVPLAWLVISARGSSGDRDAESP